MMVITIRELLAMPAAGARVCVAGWVRTRREAKGFSFIELNDGSAFASLQIVAENSLPDYAATVAKLTTGSAVEVEGTVVDSPGKGQKYELRAERVVVHGFAPENYPLQKKSHSFEFLREIAHLRGRTNTFGAVARIRSSLSFAVHSFFRKRGFHYLHTPLITASDCEGAGETFTVTTLDIEKPPRTPSGGVDWSADFFGRRAALTVSGQLEAESYALALGKVYTFGPTFRAENSNTARHLAEFWMIEPEMAFARLVQDMGLAEEFVRFLCRHVLENDRADLDFFNSRIDPTVIATLEAVASTGFTRLSYTDAVAILEKANDRFEYKVHWGIDLQSEHERYLTEEVVRTPVIVYDYPAAIKAFYMRLNDDGRTVRAMDLFVPRIGELIGGSEREERVDVLTQRIRALGLNEEDYRWYLDLRTFGSAPHAGFGLGFERLLLFVTGMKNIRDVIPFPRYPGNAAF